MNLYGITIGIISFLCIGIFRPIVVKAEYYLSARCWPLFLLAGIVSIAASVLLRDPYLSAALGVIGCSCLWSILELKEQEKRVARGWFPENPKRKKAHEQGE